MITALAIVLEAVTLSSVEKLNQVHSNFQKVTSTHKNYEKGVTLSQIIYDENSTKEIMSLIVTKEAETFKKIKNKKMIKKIYKETSFHPLWYTYKGLKKSPLMELFNTIEKDATLEEFGAIRKKSHLLKKKIFNTTKKENSLLVDLEITSLFYRYLQHHLYGSINWRQFQNRLTYLRKHKTAADWVVVTPKYDLVDMILNQKLSDVMTATTPSSFGYKRLMKELKRLRRAQRQGGWRKIPSSSQLRYGKSGKMVKRLTLRLQSEGDYTCGHKSSRYTYDNCLKKAVKRFQKRHSLAQTGKINRATRNKLNLSLKWKIKKVLLNLDRIKRLEKQAEDRYIMVNIPEFRLFYRENGRNKLTMRVVVGDKTHHTPIFSKKLSYIVLNPYWLIPDSIVKKEMIPKMLKNPNYLKERGYEVRRNYNLKRKPIDTSKIDWARVLRTGQTKRYKFMQPPGEHNALGKIKFKFPNQFAVYLHDTPAKKYFKKSFRAFSHGCVRIAEPKALLATFAKHERSVNYARAKRILRGKEKKQLNLAHPVPVHILYLTARIKSDGLLHYLPDVYGYDAKQKRTIH